MGRLAKLLRLPVDVWQMLVTWLPGPCGHALRHRFWKARLKSLGEGTRIDVGVHFEGPGWISIGSHCWIDRNVLILAGPPRAGRTTHEKANDGFTLVTGEVAIGDRTHLAPNVVISGLGGVQIGAACGVASGAAIYSYSHHYKDAAARAATTQFAFTPLARDDQQAMISGPVVLEDYCAVGLHAVLLPGALLRRGTWVASGIVTGGSFAPQSLVHEQRAVATRSLADLTIRT